MGQYPCLLHVTALLRCCEGNLQGDTILAEKFIYFLYENCMGRLRPYLLPLTEAQRGTVHWNVFVHYLLKKQIRLLAVSGNGLGMIYVPCAVR